MGMEANRSISEDEAFLRQFVFPEEERPLWTMATWDGSYRWFQSPNVICLERIGTRLSGANLCGPVGWTTPTTFHLSPAYLDQPHSRPSTIRARPTLR